MQKKKGCGSSFILLHKMAAKVSGSSSAASANKPTNPSTNPTSTMNTLLKGYLVSYNVVQTCGWVIKDSVLYYSSVYMTECNIVI